MFNLLPEIEKKNIIREYNTRRMIVALIFLSVAGLAAVVSIIPSFILSSAKVSEVSNNISVVRSSTIFEEEKDLKAALSQTNAKISILLPKEQSIYIADLFEKVLSHKTSNIRISGISYHSGEKDGGVSMSGVARSREDLSFFVEDMRKNSLFTEVNLPVSNFAKDRNSDFTIDIRGQF